MNASDTGHLMAQARLARALAQGFAYPGDGLWAAITSGDYLAEVGECARSLGLQGKLAALEAALHEAGGGSQARLEGEHTYLFERSVRCPLNASSYARGRGLGAVHDLAQAASFYGIFGYEVSGKAKELADHLCVELEFLGALCAKEVYALEQGWDERAEICADARAKFVAEHLAPWVPQFARKAEQHARLKFYPALAALVEAVVALEPAPTPLGSVGQ